MRANLKKLLVLLVLPAFLTPVFATAETVPTSNVSQRQQAMKSMANAARIINAMFKDSYPYDAKAFKTAAETIRAHSGASLSALFDGSATMVGSSASASIDTERQQFDKLANDLGIYASALSATADRNPDALGPGTRMQGSGAMMGGGPLTKKVDAARDAASLPAEHAFHLMLQTCTSCHATFRINTK